MEKAIKNRLAGKFPANRPFICYASGSDSIFPMQFYGMARELLSCSEGMFSVFFLFQEQPVPSL